MKGAAFYVILTAALLAESGAAAAQDSAARKAVFGKCQTCHAVGTGTKNKLGPELNGLAGRKAGAVAGYQYSPALKTSGFPLGSSKLRRLHARPENESSRQQNGFRGHERSGRNREPMGLSRTVRCGR